MKLPALRPVTFALLALPVLMATSRPLSGKRLTGEARSVPAGISLSAPPRADLQENVNNQGCAARQTADFALRLNVKNDSAAPLTIWESRTKLRFDGDVVPMNERHAIIGGERLVTPFTDFQIPPHETSEVTLYTYKGTAASEIDETDRIDVAVETSAGTLEVLFTGVRQVTATQR